MVENTSRECFNIDARNVYVYEVLVLQFFVVEIC